MTVIYCPSFFERRNTMLSMNKVLLVTVFSICLESSVFGATDLVGNTHSSRPIPKGGTLVYDDGSMDTSQLKYDPIRKMYYMDVTDPVPSSEKSVKASENKKPTRKKRAGK